MALGRRDFLKICTGAVSGIGIAQMFHPAVATALTCALDGNCAPVIWIRGQACGSCTSSLLNHAHPAISEILMKIVHLEYHPALMSADGSNALERLFSLAEEAQGKFFLAVEGAVPMAAGGRYCMFGVNNGKEVTFAQALSRLAPQAAAVISIGTCASYGGMAASGSNPTGSLSVSAYLEQAGIRAPRINIPGCPPHPDWIVGTFSMILEAVSSLGPGQGLAEVINTLDAHGRPKFFYGNSLHSACPYLGKHEEGVFSADFADKAACRLELGCKGPVTGADCAERRWNDGSAWCVESALCTGCTEPDFPDGKLPFYGG